MKTADKVVVHCDCEPGLVPGDVALEEKTNCDGQSKYWRASRPIGHIFGAPVEGEIEAFGPTREIALERLREEQRKLYESLWV